MHFPTFLTTTLLSLTTASPLNTRQANADPDCRPHTNFLAFNLPSCSAQLTFSRARDVGIQWTFSAIYPSSSTKTFKPHRNFSNIAVSDTFYARIQGQNYVTRSTEDKMYTSVHEFMGVCSDTGEVPMAWMFRTTEGNSFCGSEAVDSGRIVARDGVRPGKARVEARQINDKGEVEISWEAVAGAESYNAVLRAPTSSYTGGGGYFRAERGARYSASTTRAVFPGVLGQRLSGVPRNVYVNVRNAQGVWSHTPSTVPIDVIVR